MKSIDLEELLECARIGIHRASIFMSLAIETAENPLIRKFDFSKQTKLKIVENTDDDEVLKDYKDEFKNWVIGNSLRELHEGFTEYLEQLNQACLTFGWVAGGFSNKDCDRFHKKFFRDGFPDKLETLRNRFSVSTMHERGLVSLNAARNCLTHRRGIVSLEDANHGAELRLSWRALEIYFIPAQGEPILNCDFPKSGVDADGGAIESKYVERNCSFSYGQALTLSHLQLAEICFFVDEAVVELANSAVEYARSKGIKIRDRPV